MCIVNGVFCSLDHFALEFSASFEDTMTVAYTLQNRPAGIERCFAALAGIQDEVFTQIASVGALTDELEPIESRRTKMTQQVQQKLGNYRELLEILNAQLHSSEYHDLYNEDYQACVQKLAHLRARLRECQLVSSNHEKEAVNRARMAKYAPEPKQPDLQESKELLFAGRSTAKGKQTVDDQIFAHNRSITAALQNTRHMMASSVVQTELNIDNLDHQTKDIAELSFKLLDLMATLTKSKNIVRFIEKQDKKDKQRIYLSVGFLLLCSAWVLWRRIFRLPVRLLVWSILKVFRVFAWFLPNLNIKSVPAVSLSPLGMLTLLSLTSLILSLSLSLSLASLATSQLLTAILSLSEVVLDIDPNESAITWEAVSTAVYTALEYVKDEL